MTSKPEIMKSLRMLLGKSMPLILSFIFIASVTWSCGNKKKDGQNEIIEIDPQYAEYVTALTTGVISTESTIKVILSSNAERLNEDDGAIEDKIFKFDPKIEGTTRWLDYRTIEFIPNEKLPSGTFYKAEINLSKLIHVESKYNTLEFNFQIIKQNFSVNQEGLNIYKNLKNRYFLEGKVLTADIIDGADIESILTAMQSGKKMPIKWAHSPDKKEHKFVVDSIIRTEKAQELTISWDGKSINVDDADKLEIEIPAISDFKIMDARVYQYPQQFVKIQFSDPLRQSTQSLEGLIYLQDYTDFNYTIDGNVIRAYPNTKLTGRHELVVETGVKNILGERLKKEFTKKLTFTDIKPAVELIGEGVIMPNSEGLIFPFKSVNLGAVDVTIIKIYESNIPQFLQVNKLDGIKELKRVGREVYKQKVDLTSSNTVDFSSWNTYSLDLAKLIETDPGAMYRVSISFKKSYSLYGCDNSEDDEDEDSDENESTDWDQPDQDYGDENSYWDYYDGEDYNWRNKENPCHRAYYNSDKTVSRNVLASNLGIIAKMDKQNTVTAVVTDLRTLEPQANVEIQLYNFQNQYISSVKTNSEGIATLPSKIKPFLLIAKKENERGYLRLYDGSALSLTWFDISGSTVQKGIKGFIYGERGVWRPGDTIFLNFILEDKLQVLPDNHPVSFTLTNPLNQIVDKQIRTTSNNGFYNFRTITDIEAPTGNYIARMKVGGAIFEKQLKIETVKPNRLKINIDFGIKKIVADEYIPGSLAIKWLHGAVGANLRAKVSLTLSQARTSFGKYSEFIFEDPSRNFTTQEDIVFDNKVNSEGIAKLNVDINVRDAAPGMLKAQFKTTAFEEGGDFSIDQFSIPYSPYTTYVGLKVPKGDAARNMLLTDETHKVDLITVDADGKLKSRNGLKVKIYKVSWRWWWDSSEDDLGKYSGSNHYDPIFETTASTREGKGSFEFEIKYPSWGRYLVKVTDTDGHSTGKIIYADWPGWAGKSRDEGMGGASIITLATDKQKYAVGEVAELTLPEAPDGRALVSIESGSKVIEMHWVETSKKLTVFKLPITEDMAPNVFISVSLLQAHGSSVNDAPLRSYGYTPIMVIDPKTKLMPVIDMPDELKSETKVTIKVSEKFSKQMTYTLAVVDEGLLDLTRFKTPNPWSYFYAREALGIRSWDMYDMVMGAYGGNIEKTFGIGGDDEGSAEGRKKADRFKPVVIFMGPFTLDLGKENTHSFTMPKYIGSVRAMVIAGHNGAYGRAEKAVPVKNPLMVLATLPRVLSPGEEVKLPVTVFSMDEKVKKVKVRLETNDLLQASETTKDITFNKVGEKVINFGLKVKEGLGVATVNVIVSSGTYETSYSVEIDVRNPNPFVTDISQQLIEGGKEWMTNYTLPGMKTTNTAVLEVSNLPPIDMNKQLMYLIKYPHGCVEQTTSSVFPQLFLTDIVELSRDQKNEIEENIEAGIKRLHSFQISNGGLGYWPNSTSASQWGTSYAGHFLIEAELAGYDLPPGLKSNWIKYQKSEAKNWRKDKNNYQRDDLIQAYRLYTLALAGDEDYSSMNRLREQENLSDQARWRLAAAYAIAGQPEKGLEVIENSSTDIQEYSEMSNSFGSSTRDRGMILESLALLEKPELGLQVMEALSAELSSKNWHSTQTTAYCLIGISKFFKGMKSSNKISYSYTFNGKTEKISTTYRISTVPLEVGGQQTGTLKIENSGEGVLYARLIMEGQPLVNDSKTVESNLKMKIVYKDMDNNIIDVNNLDQGTDFKAEVSISNPGLMGDYKNMALSVVFPSGWEIHNNRLNDAASAHTIDVPTYQDIRDDRVYTYFDLNSSTTKTYTMLLNSSYLGKFYLPTIYCEAMYDARINARQAGKWVQVK